MYIKEIIPKTKKKSLVKTEEGISFALYNREITKYGIEAGAEISDDEWSRILSETLIPRAKKRAMHLLEKMDRTESDLARKLAENGYPTAAASCAVDYVKSFGYVDDLRYCGSYIRTYQDTKSRRRIMRELSAKGVSDDIIAQAMETEYEGDERLMIKKILDKEHCDNKLEPKERARLFNKLMRKGFSTDVVRESMKDFL